MKPVRNDPVYPHVCAKRHCAICMWLDGWRWGGLSPQTVIRLWNVGAKTDIMEPRSEDACNASDRVTQEVEGSHV